VGLQPIEELGHGVLVQPAGDLVPGIVVATGELRSRLLQQPLQRLQLVIVERFGEWGELYFGHVHYGAVPQGWRQTVLRHDPHVAVDSGRRGH
jgi:hypothetical protein